MPDKIFLHELHFKKPAGTSRGILYTKPSWIFSYELPNGLIAQTEFPIIPGLSPEFIDRTQYESKLNFFLNEVRPMILSWSATDFFTNASFLDLIAKWRDYPSFIFGLEVLMLAIKAKGSNILFDTPFTRQENTIPINGLVWMGTLAEMRSQALEKIAAGFQTVKLKIGALDWPEELRLLQELRANAPHLTIRVDANGAFQRSEVLDKLKKLSDLRIHSIEQPIAANQQEAMREVCALSPLPIALDEELIGCFDKADRAALLDKIKPQYIILKPTLLGGFKSCEEWIELAKARSIGWWITSALESNLGLNAIAQWTYNLEPHSFQGLGTGGLFTNNIEAPLEVDSGYLKFNPKLNWNLNF